MQYGIGTFDSFFKIDLDDGEVVSDVDFVNAMVSNTSNQTPIIVSHSIDHATTNMLYRYEVKSLDPENDRLTYQLTSSPAGMTVHPTRGVVVWAPSEEQVGQHQVSLRVSDGRGGSATQSFVITVDETNSAPVITSRPITTATAGLPYEYRLLAQDADGDELSFRVDAAPAGMTIERVELRNAAAQVVERFFQLRWAVPVGAAGTNPTVTVVAADGRGGEAMQTWTLNVAAANAVNGAPTIASLPPTTARLGLEWIYRVEAKDPNGDPLGYALLQKPAGMQVNASGVLSWSVPVDAPATVPVELQVSDGRGGQATQKFDLRITAIERNNTPTITSVPRQQSVTGQTYAYDPVGRDPDGDPLRWSLTSAPRGMSIDPATGNIRWTPDDLQLGAHLVAITATDPFLAQFTQRFELYVGCNNIAPAIVSIPPTTALTGRTYLYPVRAEDLEGDTLAWQLTTAPAGMAIDAKTGVIRWTPTAAQIANHDVVIAVTDGINTATQRYSIVVSNSDELVDANDPAKGTKGNRPPLITSTPKFVGEVGSLYTYQVTALDPDGDNVTISLGGTLPTGMTVNSTGLIAWTPAASSVGDFVINVVATDTHGAISTQGYLLSITVNAAPQINSTPVTNATSGSVYRYTVRATDPDGDPLTYRLATAPTGMTIDRFGRILWPSSFGDTQPQNVAVTVSDGRGKSSTQSWQITMQPDSESPKVSLSVVAGNQRFFGDVSLDVGTQYTIQFDPTDNVEVMSIALFKDGVSTGLSNPIFPRSVTFTGGVEGIFHFRATATDAAGLTGENTLTVTIGDPAATNLPEPTNPTLPPHPGFVPGDTGVPIVIITSPEPASTVSNLVPIIGTVDDPEDNLWYYRVYYARADKVSLTNLDEKDPDWVILKESTQEVIDGELAVFDPSILSNDPYALIVAAYDVNGRGFIQPTILYVEGNVQVGNFRLEFTDLSIPLAGIPIQVNRVYDTVTAGDEGDFGYGWSLGVQDARLLEVAAVGPGGALNGGNDKFIPDKTKVYLTNPSGQRVGFTYKEQLISASFFGGIWRPYFQADPGVYDTLTIDETQVARGGIVGALAQGINPNAYSLTTKDGLKYRYSKTNGLQTITDLNGNVVTFSDTGIQHSSGASIGFVRDHRGRITAIVDPAGNVIRYTYNAAGDLVKLTNQVGLETRYEYLANPAHYLDQAFDSLGKRALKAVYEQNASTKQFDFKGIIDAAGNRVDNRDFDTTQNTGIIRDANGNITRLLYDARGNVLEETDAAGNVTIRKYEDPNNPDLETTIIDRRGMVTTRQYDERGNVKQIVELGPQGKPLANPNVTEFAYNANNDVASIKNANGAVTVFGYDAKGNVTKIINALGNSSTFTYDTEGRRQSFTDFNGNKTTFEYNNSCPCGSPSKSINADGTYQTFEYNHFGQVTRQQSFEANGTLVETSQTFYDSLGRVVREVTGGGNDPLHPVTDVRKFYDGNLLDWEIIVSPLSLNPDGSLKESPATPIAQRKSRITDYEYDATDRLISQIDAMGGVVNFRYDPQGNRVLLQDPVGNITTWTYDTLNRVVEERDPLYWDALVKGTPTLLALSNSELLERIAPIERKAGDDPLYDDPSGASLATNQGAAHVRSFGYDAEGNRSKTIDRNNRRREFSYDLAGRLLEERWYNPVDHTTAPGALVETINFTYDSLGNMLTAVDSNSRYLHTYDVLNRLTSVDNNPLDDRDVPRVILSYGYDAQGNVVSTGDGAGVTVASEYDSRNRLAIRRWFDADIPTGETRDVDDARVDFLYTATGREKEVHRYGDLTGTNLVGRTLRTYDLAGRPNILDHVNAVDEVIAGYDYDYDFSGLLSHENRTHQDTQYAQEVEYNYDLTGQLVEALFEKQDDEFYEYDLNGNRNSATIGDKTSIFAAPGPANQFMSDNTYDFEYDGEGNMVRRVNRTTGETRGISYDHRNRLIYVEDRVSQQNSSAETSTLLDVQFLIDSFGRRIGKSVIDQDPRTDWFLYHGQNLWGEFNASQGIERRYLFGNHADQLLGSQAVDSPLEWNLMDLLGTTRHSMTSGGSISNYFFSVYGIPVGATPGNHISFAGREWDADVQLYNNRARHYSPEIGRFIGRDPIGFSSGESNLFRYSLNDPAGARDPSGLIAIAQYLQVSISMPGPQGPAASLIGFMHGFSAGTFEFMGRYLESGDVLDALTRTERRLGDINCMLRGLSALDRPIGQATGLTNVIDAYVRGTRVGVLADVVYPIIGDYYRPVSAMTRLACADNPLRIDVFNDQGGFENGGTFFLEFIRQTFHLN